MPWTRKLGSPIILKDGRNIATLNRAREMMLLIPTLQRETFLWRQIVKTLDDAASDYAGVAVAEAMLIRGLKMVRLL
jgi:hypothetical protein